MYTILVLEVAASCETNPIAGEDIIMLKAVIFDMDGVIIDSEPMHARAAILALKKYHIDISIDYLDKFIGSTTYYMCLKMIEDFNLATTPEELWKVNGEMKKKLLLTEGHTIVPHIIDLVKDLYTHGIKLYIASSSPSDEIEEVMASLSIKKYFDGYVSGMQVSQPKPAPDIFLEVISRLHLNQNECIVIEDSSNGVNAAAAAGIVCIGFINPNSGKQDLKNAAILVEGFDEVDYNFMIKVYQYSHLEAMTVLTTDRLIVRELTVDDIEALYNIYQDPEIREYLDDFHDSLIVEKEKHIAYIKNIYHFYGFGFWGIFLKEDQQLIGRCGIELKLINNVPEYEIGYLLGKAYQGYGYARECATAVITYSFTELKIPRIVAIIDKSNIRSLHLAKLIGMKQSGECLRNHRSCYRYEITNDIL